MEKEELDAESYCQMKNKTPVFEKKWWYSFFFFLSFLTDLEIKHPQTVYLQRVIGALCTPPQVDSMGHILLQVSGMYTAALKSITHWTWIRASLEVLVVKTAPARPGDTRDVGSHPWGGKTPWRRAWQPLHSSCRRIPWTEGPGWLLCQMWLKWLSTHGEYGNMSYQALSWQSCNVYQTIIPMKWKQFPKKMDIEEISQPRECF